MVEGDKADFVVDAPLLVLSLVVLDAFTIEGVDFVGRGLAPRRKGRRTALISEAISG